MIDSANLLGVDMPTSAPGARVLRFDDFELDVRAGELRRRGLRLRLQGQPLQVLAALLNRPGDVVTRDELRAQIWTADTFVDFDHSLHNAIARLREVLCDSAETPRYIETLPRRGYRFIGRMYGVNGQSPPRTSAQSEQPGEVPVDLVLPKRQRGWALVLTASAIIAVLAYWVTRPLPPPKVSGYVQISDDRQPKLGYMGSLPLVTDGSRLYLTETVNGIFKLAQVSTGGGDTVWLPSQLDMPNCLTFLLIGLNCSRESTLQQRCHCGFSRRWAEHLAV